MALLKESPNDKDQPYRSQSGGRGAMPTLYDVSKPSKMFEGKQAELPIEHATQNIPCHENNFGGLVDGGVGGARTYKGDVLQCSGLRG